jgi:CRP-like cAMP-binding protein
MKPMVDNFVDPSIAYDPASFPFQPSPAGPLGARRRREGAAGPREVHFPARTLIFLEGDDAEAVFQIREGAVMLYKLLPDGRRQVVELLGADDVFGFSPLLVRDCSAETLLPTRCVSLDRGQVECSPTLSRELSARLYVQLTALHEHVMLLGRKSAMERIASFLIRCVPGRGGYSCPGPREGDDHANIRLTMTRQEIADYLGLTIETVSRLLSRLKRRGLITIGRLDEIYVNDVCRLCRLTGRHLTRGRWCSSQETERNRLS